MSRTIVDFEMDDDKSKPNGKTDEVDNENFSEEMPHIGRFLSQKCENVCTQKLFFKRLPILNWLPKYKAKYLLQDFVAGLTVGLTAIPQGIAYAEVANLDLQYGLYSGFMGCFVYFLFGSCKDITIGPTAIMALMVQVHVSNLGPDFAILTAFLSGCIILLLGLLNLGFLVQFISIPVTAGFTSAAAITIASGQLKSLFGLSWKSNEFLDSWQNLFKHIGEVRLWDTVLGVVSITILFMMIRLRDVRGRWTSVTKYLSLSRNAIVVIGGTGLAYYLSTLGLQPFKLTGKVVSGFPPFRPPPFSTVVGNQTYEFGDMIKELGSSILAIPLIAILESVAIAKAFSKGKTVDATQEMIALGLCNIFGSFVSSMPTTGSFTRSAVNNSSGVRTPAGGIVTGVLVLLALGLLTKTFYYIPKATLAAVIMTAMFYMVEVHTAVEIWRTKKIDIIPMMVTLISCLFLGLEFGMLIGIAVNICFILYLTARPEIDFKIEKINGVLVLTVTPDQSLVFSSAEFMKMSIVKLAATNEASIVCLNGDFIHSVDSTVIKNISNTITDLKLQNRIMIMCNFRMPVRNAFARFDKEKFLPLFQNFDRLEEFILQWKIENNDDIIVA